MEDLRRMERCWVRYQNRRPKVDVPKFKARFEAALLGWRTRRTMRFVKTLPSVREVNDLVKLAGDLQKDQKVDNFSMQIMR